jgi:hypothetical protein
MLLAYYLAAFSLSRGIWGSRLCLPCTFCWLVCEGAASWVVGQAFNGCSLGRLGDGRYRR